MRRSNSNSFWKIKKFLPRETRNYVPQYIAVTLIASQPEKYGFANTVYDTPIAYEKYTINEAIDLNVLAKCAGVTLKEMKLLLQVQILSMFLKLREILNLHEK